LGGRKTDWRDSLIGAGPSVNLLTEKLMLQLKKPLVFETSVCKSFCKKCKAIAEVNLKQANGFLNTMELLEIVPETYLRRPEDFRGYYFEIGYCELCKPGKVSVELKRLEEQ